MIGNVATGHAPHQYSGITGPGTAKLARVLVVDDDPAMQHMLVSYLEKHNMRVLSASQKQEATRQLIAREPSIVILDLRLGQEDGLDLLREIRSRSDVLIIVTTGHRRDEIDRVVGLELGADDYVTKPFGLRELLARIRAVLRRRETGRIKTRLGRSAQGVRDGAWASSTPGPKRFQSFKCNPIGLSCNRVVTAAPYCSRGDDPRKSVVRLRAPPRRLPQGKFESNPFVVGQIARIPLRLLFDGHHPGACRGAPHPQLES